MLQLVIGLVLVLGSIGIMFALAPRDGRQTWFGGIPFIEPFTAVVFIAVLMLGVLLVAAYFGTIDNLTMLKGVS